MKDLDALNQQLRRENEALLREMTRDRNAF